VAARLLVSLDRSLQRRAKDNAARAVQLDVQRARQRRQATVATPASAVELPR